MRWPLAIASTTLLLFALIVVWPYQSGHLDGRVTILRDHFFVVTSLQDGEWLFCLAVPFITAFLIFRDRQKLFIGGGARNLHGLLVLLLGCALYWIGFWQDDRNFGFLSIQILLAGLIVWFCGWPVMRSVLFPWILFGFTWPFLPLEQLLAVPLRSLTASFANGALDLIGLDSIRHGTSVLSAANPAQGLAEGARFHLDVAQPCSGIRSLFSLMMVSAFYGYLALRDTPRRALLFAASIPLAVLGNFVRIVMLALGSVLWGSEFAVGTTDETSAFHTLSGFVVFVVALGGMIGLARILEALQFPAFCSKSRSSNSTAQVPIPPAPWRAIAPVLLATITLAVCHLSQNIIPVISEPGLHAELPKNAGIFIGKPMEITIEESRQLVDIGCTVARSSYTRPDFPDLPEMLATIVVSGAEERSLHEPDVCLPAQGWKQRTRETVTIPVGDTSDTRTATLVGLHRDVTTSTGTPFRIYAYNLFWYEGYDVSTPTYQRHIAITQRDKLFRQLTHRWSLASLFTAAPPVVRPAPPSEKMLTILREEFLEFARLVTPEMLVSTASQQP